MRCRFELSMPQVGFQARPCSPPAGPIRPGHLSHRTDAGFYPASQPSQCATVTRFPRVPASGLLPDFPQPGTPRHFLRGPVSLPHTSRSLFDRNKDEQGLKCLVWSAKWQGYPDISPLHRACEFLRTRRQCRNSEVLAGPRRGLGSPDALRVVAESNGCVGWRPDR